MAFQTRLMVYHRHTRTCIVSQYESIMFLFRIVIELTLRYQTNTQEKRESLLAGDLLFREKTKREKQKARGKENVFPRSSIISVCGNSCSVGWKTQVVVRFTVPQANLRMQSKKMVSPDFLVWWLSTVNTQINVWFQILPKSQIIAWIKVSC